MRVWDAGELARGPVAMANGVALPFRAFAGGFQGGATGIALAPAAALAGAVEGATWFFAGLTDFATGGTLAVAPDGLTEFHLDPIPFFPEDQRSYVEFRDEPQCSGDPLLPERDDGGPYHAEPSTP